MALMSSGRLPLWRQHLTTLNDTDTHNSRRSSLARTLVQGQSGAGGSEGRGDRRAGTYWCASARTSGTWDAPEHTASTRPDTQAAPRSRSTRPSAAQPTHLLRTLAANPWSIRGGASSWRGARMGITCEVGSCEGAGPGWWCQNGNVSRLRNVPQIISMCRTSNPCVHSILYILLFALANHDIPRLHHLIRIAVKQGAGVEEIIWRIEEAAQRLYSVKSFTPDERQFMRALKRLAGRKAVFAMSKFLGLPSMSTIAESDPPKLLPSVSAPKASEIAKNISTFFSPPSNRTRHQHRRSGHCIMIGGVHLCHRARWHRPTNQITGLCREHSGHLNLGMNNMDSVLEVLDAVHGDSPTCHYGREATVVAVSAFRSDNYHGLPIVQSQTCKSEKGPGFARLVDMVIEQWKVHGELGLNLQCGKGNVVTGPDPKHITKRVATLKRSNEGVVIDKWLEHLPGETQESVAILVDPTDHQNVPRAYKLIKACISLGSDGIPITSDMSPTDRSIRRAFSLAGEMWSSFLDAFIDPSFSLSHQLISLSKFAHLAFVFYRMHGSSFLSNQLYGDLQALLKCTYFCVAQQQNLDEEQVFYLYQIGSDRLEEMFAEVRTESHDSNFDSLQLSERLSNAADSVRIWNEHPDWHQGHVRRSWSGKEADHVNPTYFTGDMVVKSVVLSAVWNAGCLATSHFLNNNGIEFDFDSVLSLPGVDFSRPNGGNIYPGISREKDRSIIEVTSTVPITSQPVVSPDSHSQLNPLPESNSESETLDQGDNIEPYLPESDTPTVFLGDFLPEQDNEFDIPESNRDSNNDWLDYPLEDGSTKRLHKASILSILFNSEYKNLATTRLLRVRCYSADGHKPMLNRIEISGEHSFNVGDLGVALIRSQNTVAAAVVRVIVLEKNKVRVGQVDIEDVGCTESQVSVTAQPLLLRDISVVGTRGVESARKWIWTGDYAKFDPIKGPASTVESGTRKALTVKIPDSAAFVLENATQTLVEKQHKDAHKIACYQCQLPIKPDESRSHVGVHIVGVHILRAMRDRPEPKLVEKVMLPDPCGFCGRADCKVDVTISGKTMKATSTCTRQHQFSYGQAKRFSAATPSTNVPIPCVLCDIVPPRKTPPAFWKYSIYSHIQAKHPRYWDNLEGAPCNLQKDFADSISISSEELIALGILMGSSTAPSAKSLAGQPSRSCGTKRVLDDITTAEGGPSKRQKQLFILTITDF
ncbi:hypothetical protein B0H10DRAFT_1955815 [Mycena sp. CBHHK59/15]|nr:hypothetical protein B0H10DRAFT_1955815 [Mycena sp. CBHHK59/15]